MRASSTSMTGISSRMGYTRLHSTHLRPFSSCLSSTGALHTGQTRISSNSLLMAIGIDQCSTPVSGSRVLCGTHLARRNVKLKNVLLGGRLMVRLQTLDLRIGVRVPASQPFLL